MRQDAAIRRATPFGSPSAFLRTARRYALVAAAVVLSASVTAAEAQVPESREHMQLSFAPLVKRAAPAVVNIYAWKLVRERGMSPLLEDPFFQRFFGDNFGRNLAPRQRVQNALGSGVIIGPDGVIVTSHHVIDGADEIRVVLADRREFAASVVLKDPRTDLAVLRVDSDAGELPSLELKDSDDVEVGDLVLAIGNPFGVGQTVTSGIVSALARTQVGISDLNFFIQTDAAINPGNSGGALLAMDGRLIGINTAIFSKTGASHGIGFAIPSNMVRAVVGSVASGGKLVRPWLGVGGQGVTQDIAGSLGLQRPAGVLVKRLHASAAAAGLKVGDVVLAVNGQEVNDPEALRYRIATLTVGEAAALSVWRRGEKLTVSLPLNAPPLDPPKEATELSGPHPLAGATVGNLSPALAEELGLDPLRLGVVVLDVKARSTAARFRFRPGDILHSINGARPKGIGHLKTLVTKDVEAWNLSIDRKGKILNLAINK